MREERARERTLWQKIKDGLTTGTPSWCTSTDCHFYGTDSCNNCGNCTYCGASLGDFGENKHEAHFFRAENSGGRAWVPTCPSCNLSQGTKGLVAWLTDLREKRPSKYDRIVEHQKTTLIGSSPERRAKIARTVVAIDSRRR